MSTESNTTHSPSSFNTITIIALILLVLSLAGNVFYFIKTKKIKNEVTEQQEANDKLKVDMVSLNEQINTLNDNLNESKKNINDKDILIQRLSEENTTLQVIKGQLEEIQKISSDFNLNNEKLKQVQDKMKKTIDNRQILNAKLKEGLKKSN